MTHPSPSLRPPSSFRSPSWKSHQLHRTMQKSFIRSLVIAAATALSVMLSPNAFAQVVTSGITGTVMGADGKVAPGATVTAVHTPTNASFKAVTNAAGHYSFRSLPAGGP